jgi:polysaccharide export outer membrane protein
VAAAVLGFFQLAVAQNSGSSQDLGNQEAPTRQLGTAKDPQLPTQPFVDGEKVSRTGTTSSALVLGPGDEVEVTVYGAPDLSVHTRVSADGNISIPLIDYVRIVGLTSSEAEGAIENKLRQNNILNDPQVSVFVKEYTSSGISVVGEVAKPGSYSTLGPHRLFDVLQAAGGLTDKAANQAVITHRGSENPSTFELSRDPTKMAQSNVEIQPGDTLVVPAAPIVYVLGEVSKPGGYVLGSGAGAGVTVLRVVAAAGGPTRNARIGGTKMLRRTPNGLQELPVPLKDVMHAKKPDIPLEADDIIFVPSSRLKGAFNSGALLTALGTVALYRIP